MTQVRAYSRDGYTLVYDTDDVEKLETRVDVHEVKPLPGDKGVRREMGQSHLVLHFREGTRPLWIGEPSETGGAS